MAGADTSIYGQQVQPRFNTPFETLGQIGQLQAQQQAIQSAKALEQERQQALKKQQEQDDANQRFYAVIGNPAVTEDNFLGQVKIHAPEHLESAQKMIDEAKKNAAELKQKAAEAEAANARAKAGEQEYAAGQARVLQRAGNTPIAFELLMKLHQDAFPQSTQPDTYRDFVRKNGPESIGLLSDSLIRGSAPVSQAADKTAETTAQIPEIEAKAELAKRVTAGTSPTGMTAEQQQQANDSAARLKVSQGQLGVSQGELALRQKAEADKNNIGDIGSQVTTTASGRQYINLDDFPTPTAKEKARQAAQKAGIQTVNKDVADGLRAADTARGNFNTMIAQLRGKLPTDPTGRIVVGPKNTLEKYFQSDADLAAFGTWRQAAIQGVQALAEKGMGLRLNQTEINNMIDALPKITDTWDTAQKKIDNFTSMLDNKEKNALTKDRSTISAAPKVGDTKTFPNGKKGVWDGQGWVQQ
jgi:hypothetical protein